MVRRSGSSRAARALLILLAISVCAGAPSAGPAPAREDERPRARPGKVRRFLEEHGARLGASAGVFAASRAYNRILGPSTDPLLFDDPPWPDRLVHDRWSERRGSKGIVERYGADALRYAAPLTIIALDARDRPMMAHDLLGFFETYLTSGGATLLLKDAIGRERPELEYARHDGLDPNAIEALRKGKDSYRSFPSGHASSSFSCASYLERVLARRTGMRGGARALSFAGFYGLAGYLSYSRIAADKHYLTDVVAGAALGITVSRTFYRLNHPEEFKEKGKGKETPRPRRSRLSAAMTPAPVPGGAAVMVAISVEQPGQLRK